MPVVGLINPKGGVGKTTLATNLAGYFASSGHRTMLGDFDRQQSSAHWIGLRPSSVAPIETWAIQGKIARPARGVTHVVLDTPAQLSGARLAQAVAACDRILVPMQASMFDVLAAEPFLDELRTILGEQRYARSVAMVATRADTRTLAFGQLERFVESTGLPLVATLRDTQNYVHLAAHGLSIFDVPRQRVDKDRATWAALTRWLQPA